MQPLNRRRLPFIRNPRGPPRNRQEEASSGSSSSPSSSEPQSYKPSALDVVVTKIMLQQGLHLPPEVVLSIVDFAEYWPHTTAVLNRSLSATGGWSSENLFVLRSRPLGMVRKVHYDEDLYMFTPAPPRVASSQDSEYSIDQFHEWIGSEIQAVEHPCRKIVFTITSHDQGWGGDRPEYRGTYQGSYTWFEAGLERFDKNAERPENSIERDRTPALSGMDKLPQKMVSDDVQRDSAGESPSSSSSAFVIVPNGDEQDEGADGEEPKGLPHPYLPVYSLRPVHPSLQPDRENALHHTLLPEPDWTIQCNKTATRASTTHTVTWSWNDHVNPKTAEELRQLGRGQGTGTGAFVRNLKLGDVVTIWAKARFGSWVNSVENVRMDIYWAI